MPVYRYKLRSETGGITTGEIPAATLAEAASIVRQQGRGYLLDISPSLTASGGIIDKIRNFQVELGPGLKDVFTFTRQLSVMIKAGVNVRAAIEGIAEQTSNPKFRKVLEGIREDQVSPDRSVLHGSPTIQGYTGRQSCKIRPRR